MPKTPLPVLPTSAALTEATDPVSGYTLRVDLGGFHRPPPEHRAPEIVPTAVVMRRAPAGTLSIQVEYSDRETKIVAMGEWPTTFVTTGRRAYFAAYEHPFRDLVWAAAVLAHVPEAQRAAEAARCARMSSTLWNAAWRRMVRQLRPDTLRLTHAVHGGWHVASTLESSPAWRAAVLSMPALGLVLDRTDPPFPDLPPGLSPAEIWHRALTQSKAMREAWASMKALSVPPVKPYAAEVLAALGPRLRTALDASAGPDGTPPFPLPSPAFVAWASRASVTPRTWPGWMKDPDDLLWRCWLFQDAFTAEQIARLTSPATWHLFHTSLRAGWEFTAEWAQRVLHDPAAALASITQFGGSSRVRYGRGGQRAREILLGTAQHVLHDPAAAATRAQSLGLTRVLAAFESAETARLPDAVLQQLPAAFTDPAPYGTRGPRRLRTILGWQWQRLGTPFAVAEAAVRLDADVEPWSGMLRNGHWVLGVLTDPAGAVHALVVFPTGSSPRVVDGVVAGGGCLTPALRTAAEGCLTNRPGARWSKPRRVPPSAL